MPVKTGGYASHPAPRQHVNNNSDYFPVPLYTSLCIFPSRRRVGHNAGSNVGGTGKAGLVPAF